MTNHKGGQILQIPYWERYLLTIREAAEYFHIGEKKLRQIVEENGTADFIIMNGNRAMIKRKAFEQYLDQVTAV
jgi:excisionase family DNA binding protein